MSSHDSGSVKRLTDFMCVCSPDEKAKCDALMERVTAEFAEGNADWEVSTRGMDVLTAVVWALNWNLPDGYSGRITGLACDQWCGVSAEVQCYATGKESNTTRIFVQCDDLQHGIARAWELAKEVAAK